MSDDEQVSDYLREADHHIRSAEILLGDLTTAPSTQMRQLRAAMYIKALRRLRRLIEAHRTLPWNQVRAVAPPAPDPSRAIRWPSRAGDRRLEVEPRLSGRDP